MITTQNNRSAARKAIGLLTLVTTLGFCRGQAADMPLPTLSVAKTEAKNIASWQPAIGEGLAQMLITELNNLPNFSVLESVALDDLREERKLAENGEVSAAEGVKKGEWKGADYTFKSTITRFASKEQSFGGGGWGPRLPFLPPGGGSIGFNKTESEVQIDWRIIDNATRQIVKGASGRAVGKESGTGFNFSTWQGGGFSNNREFLDSALGNATMKAIADIVAEVRKLDLPSGARTLHRQNDVAAAADAKRNVKGTVKAVDVKEIWVSLGATNGFARGDRIK